MNYHIVIATERRAEPRELAIPILEQLHIMSSVPPTDQNDPQFVMVAEWDLQTPYVICHRGDYSKRNLHFGGWPDITKEQFDAIPAADPVA